MALRAVRDLMASVAFLRVRPRVYRMKICIVPLVFKKLYRRSLLVAGDAKPVRVTIFAPLLIRLSPSLVRFLPADLVVRRLYGPVRMTHGTIAWTGNGRILSPRVALMASILVHSLPFIRIVHMARFARNAGWRKEILRVHGMVVHFLRVHRPLL